jgi:hypothetical protein
MNENPKAPNGLIEKAADTIVHDYWGHRNICKFAGEIADRASAYKWDWQAKIFSARLKELLK